MLCNHIQCNLIILRLDSVLQLMSVESDERVGFRSPIAAISSAPIARPTCPSRIFLPFDDHKAQFFSEASSNVDG